MLEKEGAGEKVWEERGREKPSSQKGGGSLLGVSLGGCKEKDRGRGKRIV